jgi:hypothetical protein
MFITRTWYRIRDTISIVESWSLSSPMVIVIITGKVVMIIFGNASDNTLNEPLLCWTTAAGGNLEAQQQQIT